MALIYISLFWNVLLTVVVVYLLFFLKSFFPQKSRGLRAMLDEGFSKTQHISKEIENMKKHAEKLEEQIGISFKKVGVVRFNPFDRLGGEQSYSMALLNEHRSGVVVTFLYTREGVRVYVKTLKKGKNVEEAGLSEEEQKAIVKASEL